MFTDGTFHVAALSSSSWMNAKVSQYQFSKVGMEEINGVESYGPTPRKWTNVTWNGIIWKGSRIVFQPLFFRGYVFGKKNYTTNPRNNQVISRLVDANFQKTHRNTTMKQLGVSLYISGGLSTVVGHFPMENSTDLVIWKTRIWEIGPKLLLCILYPFWNDAWSIRIPPKENSKCVRMSVNETRIHNISHFGRVKSSLRNTPGFVEKEGSKYIQGLLYVPL